MNLKFEGKFKSINGIKWIDIPNLSIITGENGSGKSQLLELIYTAVTKRWKRNYNWGALPTLTDAELNEDEVLMMLDDWGLMNLNNVDLSMFQKLKESICNKFNERLEILHSYKEWDTDAIDLHLERERRDSFVKYIDAVILGNKLNDKKKINCLDINKYIQEDIYGDLKTQASNMHIGQVFFRFYIQSIEYESGLIKNSSWDKSKEKPWVILNKLIKDLQLNFELTNPEGLTTLSSFTPKLISLDTKDEVEFSDLSSGEKVLMSLAFWLFNSQNSKGFFPKLLLLDEPDAHLHPKMSKRLLYVLKDVLIKKYNIKVIMTTHSPSTIAFSPEETIFAMYKNTKKEVTKVNKDKALSILTAGIPSYSVLYENRRQVFVESPHDVLYYERLYELLKFKLEPEISLSFIAAGESKLSKSGSKIDGCDQVINITKILRNEGNNFIYGIIDGDNERSQEDFRFINILGNGNRHSIES